jgi:hypothetical protein
MRVRRAVRRTVRRRVFKTIALEEKLSSEKNADNKMAWLPYVASSSANH